MAQLNLGDLPTEMVAEIFGRLDVGSRHKMKRTCSQFKDIINEWHPIEEEPLVTNQVSAQMIKRSQRLLKAQEKLTVYRNWKKGVYHNRCVKMEDRFGWSILHLDKELLWCSRKCGIKAYRRNATEGADFCDVVYDLDMDPAIVRSFVVRDDTVISGLSTGVLCARFLSKRDSAGVYEGVSVRNVQNISSIDLYQDLVVTGCCCTRVLFFKLTECGFTNVGSIPIRSHVQCARISSEGSMLAVATVNLEGNGDLELVDTSRAGDSSHPMCPIWKQSLPSLRHLKWETPQLLWLSDTHGSLQRWDVRTGCPVLSLNRSSHIDVKCFDLDYRNAVISGELDSVRENKTAVLWDVRYTKPLQQYVLQNGLGYDRFLSSIAYDSEFLFESSQEHINVLNFSATS